MKKLGKALLYLVIAVILIAVAGVAYITLALPNVEAENIKVDITPQRVARGEYLANHVTVCMDCHSKRDFSLFAGPMVPGTLGAGGDKFGGGDGFPGDVTIPNITPYKLKDWTDGEIFRAITCGVKKNGSAIFPLMPWPYYSKMDREDVYSIIAYLRTLKPIETPPYPPRKLDFPLNIIVHTMPAKATLGKMPDAHDTVAYGAYVVQLSACKECHSKDDKGTLIPGSEFAGGREFILPDGSTVRTANITPDKATGIGNWTKEQFVKDFTSHADTSVKPAPVKPGEFQTIMPWRCYGSMKTSDLEAIYAYLKTLKPISSRFVKFQAK